MYETRNLTGSYNFSDFLNTVRTSTLNSYEDDYHEELNESNFIKPVLEIAVVTNSSAKFLMIDEDTILHKAIIEAGISNVRYNIIRSLDDCMCVYDYYIEAYDARENPEYEDIFDYLHYTGKIINE